MSKFTPGPWHVTDNGEINSDGNRWKAVATVEANWLGAGEVTMAEADANGRLIATTPELLDELQYAFDNLHKWTGSTGPGCAEWCERVRSVLVRAKGGT
jgi:hypothetical protein